MSLFKFRKNRKAVNPELWDDTPSSFPVDEEYRKSTISTSVPFGIATFFIPSIIIVLLHLIRSHSPHQMMVCLSSLVLVFPIIFCFHFVSSFICGRMTVRSLNPAKRLNRLVMKNGISSFPTLMALLALCIKGSESSSLENQITYHLRDIMHQLSKEHLDSVGQHEIEILCGLITATQESWPDIPAIQLVRMERIGAALTTCLIPVLGKIGDDQCVHALKLRYHNTQSPVIRALIENTIPKADLNGEVFVEKKIDLPNSEHESLFQKNRLSKLKNELNARRELGSILLRLLFRMSPFVLIFYFLMQTSQIPKFALLFSFLIILLVQLFISSLELMTNKSIKQSGYSLAASDDPNSILALLTTFRKHCPTRISQLLILKEILKNLSNENSSALNPKQLGTLHKMLWPEKLLKGNLWVSTMQPDKLISVETVLHALTVLGNSSTITAVSKFASETKEPDLQLKANACILSIRRRLAETPSELLRSASLNETELLMPSGGSTHNSALLLKVGESVSQSQPQNELLQSEESSS